MCHGKVSDPNHNPKLILSRINFENDPREMYGQQQVVVILKLESIKIRILKKIAKWNITGSNAISEGQFSFTQHNLYYVSVTVI